VSKIKIGVIVGSARKGSINQKFADALIRLGESIFEFAPIKIDDLPMFNQDLEHAPPPQVNRFKADIAFAQGLLFVTPEYNRALPPLLKNAIDWGTRPSGANAWAGKPAAICGTSPGSTGTLAAQMQLRQILGVVGMNVLGGVEMYIQNKPGLINEAGEVTDPRSQEYFKKFLTLFSEFC
jgi:chromate reductase